MRRQNSEDALDLGRIHYGNLDVVLRAKFGVRKDGFSFDEQSLHAIERSQSLLRPRGVEMIDHRAI